MWSISSTYLIRMILFMKIIREACECMIECKDDDDEFSVDYINNNNFKIDRWLIRSVNTLIKIYNGLTNKTLNVNLFMKLW